MRGTERALDAAGIAEPQLREAYLTCRELNRRHGRTYFLASLLLPPAKRPHVWALYGFARHADEFVDSLTDPHPEQLQVWGEALLSALDGAPPQDPVARAMVHTSRRWNLPRAYVESFLQSMRMDLTVTEYATYADLERYMYGSAAVIGLQMVPILEPTHPEAASRARALGEAFQLTNFIRDVGEDLDRGRVYLPQEDLEAFGVTRAMLERRLVNAPVRALLQFEIERARQLYAFAEPGVMMVHPTSRDCLRTALTLYRGILDEVERANYQVLTGRASVGLRRRLAVALPGALRAGAARREQARWAPA